jgi:hypothetical protein
MEAFALTDGPPTGCCDHLFTIVTLIGGATIVKLKLSLLVGSATDVAVIVGDALAPVGGIAGG